MKKWVMRIVGGLNILLVLAGVYYSAAMLSRVWNKWPEPASRLDWCLFLVFCAFDASLVALMAYFGVRLLKGDVAAIRRSSFVFFAEILLFFASVIVYWLILPISDMGFWLIATAPFAPQVLTAYPLLGLLVTLLLTRGNSPKESR